MKPQIIIFSITVSLVSVCTIAQAAFVTIGDSGNAADGGTGYGAVDYAYQISSHEVTIAEFAAALADDSRIWTGNGDYWNDGIRTVGPNAPATHINWFAAAKYCNWLTTGDAYTGAYQFDGSNNLTNIMTRTQIHATDALYYVLPTENEWYKAAYYTGNELDLWSSYATGADSTPSWGGWNYFGSGYLRESPNYVWETGSSTEEQNATFDMMGNVWEWTESAYDGTLNSFMEDRAIRGGAYNTMVQWLGTGGRIQMSPTTGDNDIIGFRIVAISTPELMASTIDPVNKFAYGANMGWINAYADGINGAVIGQAFCSGYMYGANVGWIHLGDGTPANGIAYANESNSDYGVNHDGTGKLSGYAYGANIGWINFEQTYGNPKVDLLTGSLSGYAWGANVGWINLSGAATLSLAMLDTDSDGISDAWEYGHTNVLNVLASGGMDSDGDGVLDVDEYAADTDPFDASDYLAITDFQTLGNTNWVTWTCEPTRIYTLQHAAALSNGMEWTATSSSFIPPFGPEVMEEVSGVSHTNRVYRVEVVLPLSL